jgi:hypothetical protein
MLQPCQYFLRSLWPHIFFGHTYNTHTREQTYNPTMDDMHGDYVSDSDSETESDAPPAVPEDASILQCVKGIINIFEAARDVDIRIVDRASLKPLFEGCKKERILLHDANILQVLSSIYDVCANDEAIMRKLHAWTVHGTKRTLQKEQPSQPLSTTVQSPVETIQID